MTNSTVHTALVKMQLFDSSSISFFFSLKIVYFLPFFFLSIKFRFLTGKLLYKSFDVQYGRTWPFRRKSLWLDTSPADNVSVSQPGLLPLRFQPHLFPLLPPEFSATFKVIHSEAVGLGSPDNNLDLKGKRQSLDHQRVMSPCLSPYHFRPSIFSLFLGKIP